MYVREAVYFLNAHKEIIKDIVSVPTCVFGLFGAMRLYDDVPALYDDLRERIVKGEAKTPWSVTAGKVVRVMTGAALLLSSFTSRPGQAIIGWTAKRLVGEAQLTRLFGPNLNFVTNPYHPKHVVSIAAFLLAIPGALHALYTDLWQGCGRKLEIPVDNYAERMNIYNVLTSRPLLHLLNLALSRS